MYCIIPVSVNECNLREVYTIAHREVRQREMMTSDGTSDVIIGRNLDSASNRPVVMRFQLI
jgi:hypothetical protein